MYQRFGNAKPLNMRISQINSGFTNNPDIFGPSFWFTLHNGAIHYPIRPSLNTRQSMKTLIYNLPILVPCLNCRDHFINYIQNSDLDYIVSSKETLFKFWVDIHNHVNKRYNRPEMTLLEAKRLYGFDTPESGAIMTISYQ
jgi:hypothetical protein